MTRPDVGVMRALLARVKVATGPDRRLDYEIFTTFATPGEANPWDPASGHFLTASIDAAIALVERALPGWGGRIAFAPSGATVRLWHLQQSDKIPAVDGATPALALLAGALTALIAAEDQAHG